MNRYKIEIVTTSDAQDFADRAKLFPKDILRVRDFSGHEVSAQSLLGILYSCEWKETYLYSLDEEMPNVYETFADFIVEEEA